MEIRESSEADRKAIHQVHVRAFGGGAKAKEVADLSDAILHDDTAMPRLSLVAVQEGRIIGHILFSKAGIIPVDESLSLQILAPLAVDPDLQGRGVGRN